MDGDAVDGTALVGATVMAITGAAVDGAGVIVGVQTRQLAGQFDATMGTVLQ